MIFPTPPQRQNWSTPRGNNMSFGPRPSRHPTSFQQSSMLQPENISSMATKGASSLANFLANAQQVLNVIETTAPLVQQYGPMIKNLPALYRMMKAVNDVDVTDESSDQNTEVEENKESHQEKNPTSKSKDHDQEFPEPVKTKKQRRRTGKSEPLLFI